MAIKGRDAWVEQLSKRDMPVLAGIVQELNELTGDDDTEVNQLADVILKDANLTSQVLRIANSVQYNPSSYPINTVSRAIVLIGFSGVKAICISVMVIDSLLGKEPRERLLEQMAQSFHAAVQSRNLVRRTNSEVQEEVFIASLLYHLGEMAFWASGGTAVDTLDELLRDGAMPEREAVDQVLGCTFKAISKSLAESWNLGDTLGQSLYPPKAPSPKVVAVILGQQVSQAAINGWDSAEMQEVIKRLSQFNGLSLADTKKSIMDAADEAASVALTYGASKILHLIPGRRELGGTIEQDQFEPMKADPQLQLNILRELSNALMENLDVNAIFQMVLEGLHRGVGLERVALSFVKNDRAQAKYILGDGTGTWREKFSFPVDRTEDNIFTKAISTKDPVWYRDQSGAQHKHLYSPEIKSILGAYPAFVAPVFIGGRCIALFYADRWKLGGEMSEEQFQSFRHFILQTQMSLQMLAERR